MFHDSTSVLPPVTQHAVHPAQLHPFLWRAIALALALSEHGGGRLSEMAYPGLKSTSCRRCSNGDSPAPNQSRRKGRPATAPLTAANMDAAASRPANRLHLIARGLHEGDELTIVLPNYRMDSVDREYLERWPEQSYRLRHRSIFGIF